MFLGAMNYITDIGYWLKSRRLVKRRSSLLLALMFFYFSFHLVSGERGLLAYAKLKGEIDARQQEQHATLEEKGLLAHRVIGLRSESLDLDLLEEVAREDLGYSKRNEIIYFWE